MEVAVKKELCKYGDTASPDISAVPGLKSMTWEEKIMYLSEEIEQSKWMVLMLPKVYDSVVSWEINGYGEDAQSADKCTQQQSGIASFFGVKN